MNARSLAILSLLLAATPCLSQRQVTQTPLQRLIQENIDSAVKADRRYAQQITDGPKLWIHIRDASQQALAKKLGNDLATLTIGDRKLALESVQVVSTGPDVSELRYFRSIDSAGAQAILNALRQDLTHVRLNDLSAAYAKVAWIQPGHYELWLAPVGPQRRSKPTHNSQ